MTDRRQIGVAIAGCGQITRRRHAPEYQSNPYAVIRGFYDHTISRAEEMAARYGGRVYETYEELLADEAVEAVSVCTPNFLHSEMSIRALDAGKHVLVEKPIAESAQRANQMIEAQRRSGKVLMPGHNQRFIPAHQRAKELLGSGMIGDVISISANFKHRGPEHWSVGGENTWFFSRDKATYGVLGDLGAHKIDLISYLIDDEIESIFSRLLTLDKRFPSGELIDLEDNAYCLFRTKGGVPGSIEVSWTNYGLEDNSTSIYGTKGCMKIFSSPQIDILIEFSDGSQASFNVGGISTNVAQLPSGVIDAFIASVQGADLSIHAGDGRHSIACLEAARKSDQTGAWERVQNDW